MKLISSLDCCDSVKLNFHVLIDLLITTCIRFSKFLKFLSVEKTEVTEMFFELLETPNY